MDQEKPNQSTETNTSNEAASPELKTNEPTNPMSNLAPVEATSNKSKMVPIILAIVLLIVVGSGAAMYLNKGESKTTSTKVSEVVKKEIPLIRVMQPDVKFNNDIFPPTAVTNNGQIGLRRQMFESLVSFSEIKNLVPQLASSWTNPDTNTWIFKLRNDVKFHNGTRMTSKSVKESLDAAKLLSDYSTYTSTIKSIEVIDDYSIKLTTTSPDGALLNKLAFISVYDTSAKVIDDQTGTGPYELKKGTTLGATADLVAVANYYGGTVYTKEVLISEDVDTTKIRDAVIAGTVDIGVALKTDDFAKIKETIPSANVISAESQGTFGLYLNTVKPGPLQKLAVRQAIYKALDMKKLIIAGGSPGKVATQIVPSQIPGYNPSITPPVRDIAASKKLLSDAGYATGVKFTITHPKSSVSIASEIKSELAEVNIDVTIVAGDSATYFNDSYAGKFDAWLAGYTTDINDASDVISTNYGDALFHNFYINKDVQKNVTTINQTADAKKRLMLMQDTIKLIMNDLPFVPIRNRSYEYIITKPYELALDTSTTTSLGVSYWKTYQK